VKRTAILISLFVITSLLLSIGCGPGEPKTTLEKIKRENKLIIGTHPFNPPFEFGSGTGVDGFDYELTEAIAREMGVKTQWIKKNFEECFEYLQTKKVDLVVNAVTITPERSREFLFSTPYFTTGQVIAIRREREDILSVDDLQGKRVGVQKDTTADAFMKEIGGTVEIVRFDSFDDALFELNRKLLDAVVGDAPTLIYDLKLLTNLRTVGNLLTKEEYGLVFRKSDPELKAEVDRIIKKLQDSGELGEMVKKWKLDITPEDTAATPPPATN